MFHEEVARKLSAGARDLLVEHVDGPRFVEVPVVIGERTRTRHMLLNLRLIKCGWVGDDGKGRGTYSQRPATTYITDDGRQVLAIILAEYAEALIRAGYGVVPERSEAIVAVARTMRPTVTPTARTPSQQSLRT